MSKLRIKIIIVVIIFLAIAIFWYFYPKNYNKTLKGVFYSLEDENISENVKVHMDGKLQNYLFGKRKFEGKVELEGNNIPEVKGIDETGLELWAEDRFGVLTSYGSVDEEGNYKPSVHFYGFVYVNKDFSQLTIMITPEDESGLWSETEQLVITAPAGNRDEAIEISNKLMEEYDLNRK